MDFQPRPSWSQLLLRRHHRQWMQFGLAEGSWRGSAVILVEGVWCRRRGERCSSSRLILIQCSYVEFSFLAIIRPCSSSNLQSKQSVQLLRTKTTGDLHLVIASLKYQDITIGTSNVLSCSETICIMKSINAISFYNTKPRSYYAKSLSYSQNNPLVKLPPMPILSARHLYSLLYVI